MLGHGAARTLTQAAPHQGGAGLLGDQGLGAQGFFQLFDFLGAIKQAGLFGILGVKADAVGADGMAFGHQQPFTGLELAAAVQGFIQGGGGVATL